MAGTQIVSLNDFSPQGNLAASVPVAIWFCQNKVKYRLTQFRLPLSHLYFDENARKKFFLKKGSFWKNKNFENWPHYQSYWFWRKKNPSKDFAENILTKNGEWRLSDAGLRDQDFQGLLAFLAWRAHQKY